MIGGQGGYWLFGYIGYMAARGLIATSHQQASSRPDLDGILKLGQVGGLARGQACGPRWAGAPTTLRLREP